MRDKCKIMRPRHLEWETSVGDKYKLMRDKTPRVGDKCAKQVGDKSETSVNSYGPKHPRWETSVQDMCKLMQLKAPRVGD